MIEIRILGPVAATVDGAPVRMGPQVRALLAALVVEAGRVVPVPRLIDLLWGETAPDAAASTLRSHVKHLRRMLEPDRARGQDPRLVVTAPSGYLLRIEPEQLDADRFERLVAAGQYALAAGQPGVAAERLRGALALCRGPVLADVADRPFARPVIARLDALRDAAVLARVEADLARGLHHEVAGELSSLVGDDPLNESVRRLLVLALYRCGRVEEAARACRDGLALLHTHGLASAGLAELQQRLLNDAGELAWRPQRRPRPFLLPPDVPRFINRDEAVAELIGRLTASTSAATVAVYGPPGIGKSALATHVAHRLASRFGDGLLHVNLRGAGQHPLTPLAVLGQFLRALDVADGAIPTDLDTATAAYRSALADRRVLVVLDDAAGAKQVRPLLPTGPGCAALVTSRTPLSELDGAVAVALGGLCDDAAVALLAQFVGVDQVSADPAGTGDVVRWCGGLPLALRIAGARLRSRPGWSLGDLARRLADAGQRLDELAVGDQAVRSSFQLSYRALAPDDQRLFRLLGLVDGPTVTVEVGAALTGGNLAATRSGLERLVDAQLVESPEPGRYRFHDLMRLFAREQATAAEPEADRDEALRRALTWYLAGAVQAYLCLAQADHPRLTPPEVHPPAPSLVHRAQALAWLEAERANLVVAARTAAAHSRRQVAETAWRLDQALRPYLQLRSYWSDWHAVCEAAVRAARRFDEPAAEVAALNRLGMTLRNMGRPQEATGYFEDGLAIGRRIGDRRAQVFLRNNLGNACLDLGLHEQAVGHLKVGLALSRELGHREDEAMTLDSLGMVHAATGDHRRAVAHLERSLAISREAGYPVEEAETLIHLGDLHLAQLRMDDAVSYYERCLTLSRTIGSTLNEAMALWGMGRARLAAGDGDTAAGYLDAALEIFTDLGTPQVAAVRALLDRTCPAATPCQVLPGHGPGGSLTN